MELLHTLEEITTIERKNDISSELDKLYKRLKDDRLSSLSSVLKQEVKTELDKYQQFVGLTGLVPPSTFSDSKEWRHGTITEFTHFNAYSKTVRMYFKYDIQIGGGFDGHSLLEFKPD